jgi:hypothetical protein
VNVKGAAIAPIAWEASCLEETCGACTMMIQGRPRQACATLVSEVSPKGQPIVLEPLGKFPVERDLIVDRAKMFDALTRVRAWVKLDGSASPAPAEGDAWERRPSAAGELREHGGQPAQQAEQLCDLALCRKPQPPERLHTGGGLTGLCACATQPLRAICTAARSPLGQLQKR